MDVSRNKTKDVLNQAVLLLISLVEVNQAILAWSF